VRISPIVPEALCFLSLMPIDRNRRTSPSHSWIESRTDDQMVASECEGDINSDRHRCWKAMVKRRAMAAGLPSSTCCHTFRATGITTYLLNGGPIGNAQLIEAHESPWTTKLYDRTRGDSAG
jgi:integrase